MQPIGSTLRVLRTQARLSQAEVAEWMSSHYKKTRSKMISAWECGDNMPNAEQILHLCDLYGVDDVLLTFMGKQGALNDIGLKKLHEYAELLKESKRYTRAPEPEPIRELRLYDMPVSAGTGSYLDESSYDLIEADASVPASADYAVKVRGDSMLPRFLDGQIVWIHKQPTLENGEIGIFYYDGESYIKKLEDKRTGLRLISLNPEYTPIQIRDMDSFRIFGKVVG